MTIIPVFIHVPDDVRNAMHRLRLAADDIGVIITEDEDNPDRVSKDNELRVYTRKEFDELPVAKR